MDIIRTRGMNTLVYILRTNLRPTSQWLLRRRAFLRIAYQPTSTYPFLVISSSMNATSSVVEHYRVCLR